MEGIEMQQRIFFSQYKFLFFNYIFPSQLSLFTHKSILKANLLLLHERMQIARVFFAMRSLFIYWDFSANLISCGKIYGKHFLDFCSMSEVEAGESAMAYFMSTAEPAMDDSRMLPILMLEEKGCVALEFQKILLSFLKSFLNILVNLIIFRPKLVTLSDNHLSHPLQWKISVFPLVCSLKF